MSKIVKLETAELAKRMGYTEQSLLPTQDEIQTWLESKGMYISIAPEMYTKGINWNWQVLWYLPESQWDHVEIEDEDTGEMKFNPTNICEGTGWYGDNGEFPTRHEAMEAALVMGLMKTDIYYRHNSIEGLSKLYKMNMNSMLDLIRPHSAELGDWSFRDLTMDQLKIIVSKIGEPK